MATQVIKGDGTTLVSDDLDAYKHEGSLTVHVTNATSRSDAISQATTDYPTHPDNANLVLVSTRAIFDGFTDCSGQSWIVTLQYARKKRTPTGVLAKGFSGAEYTANDKHGYTITQRFYDTTIDAVIAANTIGTFGPNGEPYSSHLARVVETRSTGDVVDITVEYQWPKDTVQAKAKITHEDIEFPAVPKQDMRELLTTVGLDTPTAIDTANRILSSRSIVKIPLQVVNIFWRSNTSAATALDAHISKFNTAAYTLNGKTYADQTLRYIGAEEIDNGASISPRYEAVLKFHAYPFKEARYVITVDRKPGDPTDQKFTLTDPYSSTVSQSAFPALPTYIP